MTKLDFLFELRRQLSELPKKELDEQLKFYCEMIEDRMEDGLSEEAAVEAVGAVEQIAEQIRQECDVKPKHNKEKGHAGRTVLLIAGSPIWGSLLIAAFAVVLALYISLWAVLVSLWAVAVSVVACAVGGVIAGVVFACTENLLPGIALIGGALVCGGLGILMVYGCKVMTAGFAKLTKNIVLRMKKRWHHE